MFHELPSAHGAEGRKYVWEKSVAAVACRHARPPE